MVRRFFSFFLVMGVLQTGPVLAHVDGDTTPSDAESPLTNSPKRQEPQTFWERHPTAAKRVIVAGNAFLLCSVIGNMYLLSQSGEKESCVLSSPFSTSSPFPNVTNSSTETQNLTNFLTTLLSSTPYPKTSESAVTGGSQLAVCQDQLSQLLENQGICLQDLQGARNETEAVKNAFEQVRTQFPEILEYFRRWVDTKVPLEVMTTLGKLYPEGCVKDANRTILAAPWNASMAALQGMRNCFR